MAGGWKESQTTDSALAVMWAVNGQQPTCSRLGVDHVFWFVILANIDQQTAGGSFENDLR